MASAFLEAAGDGRIDVRSAGSQPADELNPAVLAAMRELGIDLAGERPKLLTDDGVRTADVVITMGCGDACPYFPGKDYRDWVLDDPAGLDLDGVRPIRDEIRRRVDALAAELLT
jgi:arsenate reductase